MILQRHFFKNLTMHLEKYLLHVKNIDFRYTGKNTREKYFRKNVLNDFPVYYKNAAYFLNVKTPTELCWFFRSTFFELEKAMNQPVYHRYKIPKKKGGTREIYAPGKELMKVQKRLNYFLQAYYLIMKPSCSYGFVINYNGEIERTNIVRNALPHTNKKHVLSIDLKDFFPSIKAHRVKNLFLSHLFQFDENIATALALLTTYKGELPAGAPSSPIISNFICYEMDNEMQNFCTRNQLTYTRYADDLTFSSDYIIGNDLLLDIISIINKHDFTINEKKLRLANKNSRQTVTGLVVNEKVNVNRKLIRNIRAMIHDLKTNGINSAVQNHFQTNKEVDEVMARKFIFRLYGFIHFIGQVRGKNDGIYLRMLKQVRGDLKEKDEISN